MLIAGARSPRRLPVVGFAALALGLGLFPAATPAESGVAATCAPSKGSSIADRAALRRLLFLGFTNEAPARLESLARNGVGGFFIMGNRRATSALPVLKAQLEAIDRGTATGSLLPFVAIDEEGGRVQRLKVLGTLPSARAMGAMTPTAIRKLAAEHGAKMRAITGSKEGGIDMDFAPVLDLDARTSGVIATRSFSSDPGKAWAGASAFAAGLDDAGLIPVFKHFPGHGRASGDSHALLPSTPPVNELETKDLVPYREMIAASTKPQVVMVGHLVTEGLSTDLKTPTSLSPGTYTYLRTKLGFKGLAITDDLGMGALASIPSNADRMARAVIAGADMVLFATTAGVEGLLNSLEPRLVSDNAFRAAVLRANASLDAFVCGSRPTQ